MEKGSWFYYFSFLIIFFFKNVAWKKRLLETAFKVL